MPTFRMVNLRVHEGDQEKLEALGIKLMFTGYGMGRASYTNPEYVLVFKEDNGKDSFHRPS